MKKLSKWLKYIALAILLGGWLLFHFHFLDAGKLKVLIITAIIASLTGTIMILINLAKAAGKRTGLQKVSSIIIYIAAIAVTIALVLTILHMRDIGRPLLNFSLVLFIAGMVVLMVSQVNSKNTTPSPVFKGKTSLYNNIICLGSISTIIGMLLRINHYPGGKPLMFGSLGFMMAFMIFLVAHAKYIKKRETL